MVLKREKEPTGSMCRQWPVLGHAWSVRGKVAMHGLEGTLAWRARKDLPIDLELAGILPIGLELG